MLLPPDRQVAGTQVTCGIEWGSHMPQPRSFVSHLPNLNRAEHHELGHYPSATIDATQTLLRRKVLSNERLGFSSDISGEIKALIPPF